MTEPQDMTTESYTCCQSYHGLVPEMVEAIRTATNCDHSEKGCDKIHVCIDCMAGIDIVGHKLEAIGVPNDNTYECPKHFYCLPETRGFCRGTKPRRTNPNLQGIVPREPIRETRKDCSETTTKDDDSQDSVVEELHTAPPPPACEPCKMMRAALFTIAHGAKIGETYEDAVDRMANLAYELVDPANNQEPTRQNDYLFMPDDGRTIGDWKLMWVTGTGQLIRKVHSPYKCAGESCSVHNPSDHHMRTWDTHLRTDSGIFTERICEHGVGHPDPDDPFAPDIHVCDGCCHESNTDVSPDGEL